MSEYTRGIVFLFVFPNMFDLITSELIIFNDKHDFSGNYFQISMASNGLMVLFFPLNLSSCDLFTYLLPRLFHADLNVDIAKTMIIIFHSSDIALFKEGMKKKGREVYPPLTKQTKLSSSFSS